MLKKKNGFTIVELLAVIVILAIVITIAATSVFGTINNSHKKMTTEVRNNLKEASLTYVMEKFHLEKCSTAFSKEVFENQNITNAGNTTNSKCVKKVTIKLLFLSGAWHHTRVEAYLLT